jgi:hypothetical protein
VTFPRCTRLAEETLDAVEAGNSPSRSNVGATSPNDVRQAGWLGNPPTEKMTITIPIYIEKRPSAGAESLFVVTPLFLDTHECRAQDLSKAMTRLVQALRKELSSLARAGRCDQLLDYLAPPEWEDHSYKVRVELRKGTAEGRFHVVAFRKMGKRLAFSPTVSDLWFECERGTSLRLRAEEVLTRHYQEREKEGDEAAQLKQEISRRIRTWTTSIDIDIDATSKTSEGESRSRPLSFLGGGKSFHGAEELEKVGRCLEHQSSVLL